MSAKILCRVYSLMLALCLGGVAWGLQMPRWINNARDLKFALKAAKTPEDHERIAGYCEARADRLNADAADYERAAEAARQAPVVKNLTSPTTAPRYEYLAKQLRQQAATYERLAASQRRLADDAQ